MSDDYRPGDVPPDLPPEYAEAYRRGYERAYGQVFGEDDAERSRAPEPRPLFADEVEPDPDPDPQTEVLPEPVPVPVTAAPSVGSHRAEPEPMPLEAELSEPYDDGPRERPAWLVPALLAGLIVVLLLGAYGIGRVLSDNLSSGGTAQKQPDGVVINEDGTTSAPSSPKASHKPAGKKYTGNTDAAAIGGATATCESPKGVDAAGNPVRYAPANIYDQDMTTAWRCDGDGVGQKLTIALAHRTSIGQVGLIPGYAKTDPRSGQDRYAENNRITKVRWVFDDGTTVEQTFDPSVRKRSMQSMRIPVTKAAKVVVQVLGSQRGPRDTIAVSEVRIGRVAG